MKKVILLVVALAMLAIPSAVQGVNDPTVKEAAEYVPPISESVGVPQVKKVTPASLVALGAPEMPSSYPCWQTVDGSMHSQWGIWPWSQRVTENRFWCAEWVGGPQYWRTSHVYLTSPRCNSSGAYGRLVDGGNGYSWATVRSGGFFWCDGWNFNDWVEFACNTWGNCAYVRRGRL
jgi:hypothetical protein